MDLRGVKESPNYTDDVNPSLGQYLKTHIGAFLLRHGVINDATGHPYNPTPNPQGQMTNVPVGPDGRRSDIDWGSNSSIPGAPTSLMSHLTNPNQQTQNDAMARHMGFKDANTAAAYYQRQQEMRTGPAPQTSSASSGGSLLDRALSIHPAVMLGHVLDAWNNATGGQ